MRLIIYSLLVIEFLCCSDGVAQGCDDVILEKGKALGNLGYQARVPKSRCEGLYYDNASGVAIDLVSFTRGEIRYQLRPEEIINIHYSSDKKFGSIWVRGTSFKSNPKYRLDMPLDHNKRFAQIPVKDVLNQSRLSSTNIGFYGYTIKENTMLYFPISITSKFYNSSPRERIIVRVLSNVETDQVVYKFADRTNGLCGKFSPEINLNRRYDKLEPIEIELNDEVFGKELCLEVSVRAAGTIQSWTSKEFTIYIPAR